VWFTAGVPPEPEPCIFNVTGKQVIIHSNDIKDRKAQAEKEGFPLDCMWIIQVDLGWKVKAFLLLYYWITEIYHVIVKNLISMRGHIKRLPPIFLYRHIMLRSLFDPKCTLLPFNRYECLLACSNVISNAVSLKVTRFWMIYNSSLPS